MKRLFLSLLVILAISFSTNQSYAIPPVSQLGHQSWGAPAERVAAKIWGNVYIADTAFVGVGTLVRVFEINHSTPSSPTELTSLNFSVPGKINSIALNPNNQLTNKNLILVGHSNGLTIRNYQTLTSYTTPIELTGNSISDAVFVDSGDTAYIAINYIRNFPTIKKQAEIKAINLSNPATASVISTLLHYWSNYTINALAFRRNFGRDTLFVAGSGYRGLRIFDGNSPLSIQGASNMSFSGDSLLNDNKQFKDIVIVQDSIYVADQDSGYRSFSRANINVPGNLTVIPNTQTNYITLAGQDTLVTSSNDGIRTWRASTKQLLTGPITVSGYGPSEIVTGSDGTRLYSYMAFKQKGFQVFSGYSSSPAQMSQVGTGILTGDNVYDVVGDDRNYAYIANGVNGVQIINLTNHSLVSSYLFYQSGESYKKVLIHENTLVMFWANGFNMVDVSNPSSPQLRGTYNTGISGVNDADIRFAAGTPDTLWLAIGDNQGLKLFNILNPSNITQIGSTITLPGGCTDVQFVTLMQYSSPVMYAPYLFAAPGYGNLAKWLLNTNSPSVSFWDSTTGLPPGKFVANDILSYFIAGDSIKKISSWDFTVKSNFYGISGTGGLKSIELSGNFLHIGANNNRMYVIDTTNKTTKDTFNINDTPSRLKINGLNLLVTAQADGYYHLSDPYGAARIRMLKVSGMPKDTVTLPVRVLDNLSQLGVLSFEMLFRYDSNYVKFANVQRGPGLPSTDSLLATVTSGTMMGTTNDTLKIVRADTGEIPGASVAGKDTLLKIKFRIKDNAPVQPLVQSVLINSNRMLLSEGFPVTDFKPGRIYITPRFGDANQNGAVTAADASYILQSVIGLTGPPPMALADVSNNGEIRAYDAALILKRMVNPAFKYPVETYYGLKQASAPVNKDVRILLSTNTLSSESDETAEVNANSVVYEISMKNVKEVWSAEMIIDLGKGQKYTGYKLSSLSAGMTVQSRQEGTLLYISIAGGEAITKDGLLLQIICQIIDAEQVKPVEIQQFILNETLIENIEGSLSGIPKTYALGQNYPNPFNPVTEIKYQLPNASKVTLTIYNIIGQQVKTLVNATQQVGYYTIQWNGKDDASVNVASGVYFYRIRAGNFVQTKKMMFIK